MNTLAEFFIALMFYGGVALFAMLFVFCVVWIVFAVAELRAQQKIKRNWKENP